MYIQKISILIKSILKDTFKIAGILFKIMIPVSIGIKLLQLTNIIPLIGKILNPLMNWVGLPGEMGIVWATSMITNIYGGIIALLSIRLSEPLSIAQMSVLATMILVAHTFPIELQISRKAGIRLRAMFLIRFGFALIVGIILNQIYQITHTLQNPSVLAWKPEISNAFTWTAWIIKELKNYGIILLIILSLIICMRTLEYIGITKLMIRLLKPFFKVLGISSEVITITITGLIMGIAYGGALIINETKEKQLPLREVFYALTFMGLCHSMIEDTLLMIAIGGHYSAVLIARIFFAFIVTFIIVRLTRNKSDRFFYRFLIRDNHGCKKNNPSN